MKKPNILIAALAVLVLVAFAGPAFAQQAAADTGGNTSLGKIIIGGGLVGWVIILLSIISLALAIEHFVTVRRDKIVPPELIDELEALFEEEEYQEALELCESEPNFLTNILSAGLPKINAGFDAMEKAMDDILGGERSGDNSVNAAVKLIDMRLKIGDKPLIEHRTNVNIDNRTINHKGALNITKVKELMTSDEILDMRMTGIIPDKVRGE